MSEKRKKTPKRRLDLLLVERGLVQSRERAKAMVLAGRVVVDEHAVTKAGMPVAEDAIIRLKGEDCPFVSRGGLKLSGTLDHFSVNPEGYVCLDVGASTGGFTDCLLQRGAKRIYALDVGTNQLAWKLRKDERVVVWENTHVKELKRENIPESLVDLIVIDASFISLRLVLPPLLPFLKEGSRLLALVKPQFEVGRENVGKGGVVREERLREEAVQVIVSLLESEGIPVAGSHPAPIKGPKGNQEIFIHVDGATR